MRDVEPGELVIDQPRRRAQHSSRSSARASACASSSTSISRGPTASSTASASTRRASASAPSSRARATSLPTSSSRCPIRACRRRIGYAAECGLPFELGIIRNHYVGRTFIEPTDHIRHLGVKLKHNANGATLEGKRVILVDNSIVRGTTSTKIVAMVRQAGAREVHMRISSPPTTNSCFYGIATPEREQLLASRMSVAEMTRFIEADSLAFISIDGLYRAMGETRRDARAPQYCDACFTGDYAIPLADRDAGKVSTQLSLLAETV